VASLTGTVASPNVPEAFYATPDRDGNPGGYEEPQLCARAVSVADCEVDRPNRRASGA